MPPEKTDRLGVLSESKRWRGRALWLVGLVALACRPSPARSDPESAMPPLPDGGLRRCVVHLHGKGARCAAPEVTGGLVHLRPQGNGEGWGGRQWLYFPASRFLEMRQIIDHAIAAAGCTQVLLHGFSNGASAAARLVCSGESFGDKLVGTIVDDPVPDHGVEGCAPKAGAKIRLYVTGALAEGAAGALCAPRDWTCEGGSTIGIGNYARLLGVPPVQSPNTTHAPLAAPPEYKEWW